jgi:hypothetical protein
MTMSRQQSAISRRVLLAAAAGAACLPVRAAPPALDSVALVQAAGIGGGGNTALGGATMIAAWSNIRFERDGTDPLAQGAGGSAPGVVTSSTSADAARYKIEGHRIVLTGGTGQRQATTFFLFPDSDGAIGIGNRVYSRRDK